MSSINNYSSGTINLTYNNYNYNYGGTSIHPKLQRKQLKEANYYSDEEETQNEKNEIVRIENRNGQKTYVVKYTPGATITIGGRSIHFK